MSLRYETLISEGVVRARGALPSGEPITSSPITSTLIYGAEDAVLIDPPFTTTQTQNVIDWLLRSGKRLRYIYATHGHGDHWFGSGAIVERFPGVEVCATAGTHQAHAYERDTGARESLRSGFPQPDRADASSCRNPFRPRASSSKGTGSSLWKWVTPTRTIRPSFTYRIWSSWLPEMSSTTESIPI